MASLPGIILKITSDTTDAVQGLNRVNTALGKATTPMDRLGAATAALGVAIVGAFSVSKVVSFLEDSAKAAMEDEASMVKLAKAMDNLGMASENVIAEESLARMSTMYGIADDSLRPALQSLLTVTGDLATSQDALQLALDISAGTGRDLAQVTQALSRGYSGSTTALSRLGAGLDTTLLKSKDMDAITGALSQKFSGQAAAAADTYAGKMNRITVAAGEAQEKIGYALLNALDSIGDHAGGVDGLTAVMDGLAIKVAHNIDLMGGFVEGLVSVANATPATQTATEGLFGFLGTTGPEAISRVAGMFKMWTGYLSSNNAAMEEGKRQFYDIRTESDAVAASTQKAAQAFGGMSAESAAAAFDVKLLKDAFDDLNSALGLSQSRDDFKKFLADLDETLKGNTRSLKGMGDGAKENRDTLRDAFSTAASLAQKWAEENGKSVSEMQGYYNGLAKKIVTQFTRDGFKRSDVLAFLGGEGIWTQTGQAIGIDLTGGLAQGIRNGTIYADAAVRDLIKQTEAGARAAAESKSPSKLFSRVGRDLALGLAEGAKDKDALAGMKAAFGDWFTDTVNSLKEKLQQARDAFNSFKTDVASAIYGGIDFAAIAPQFDADGKRIGMTFIDALTKQAEQAKNFAAQVKTLITMGLSKDALQQVLSAGVQAGTNIANELIAGGSTTIEQTNQLVATTQAAANEVGELAATNWFGAGVTSAQQTYEGFKANFGKDGPARKALMGLMDNIANAMNRTATITVTTVHRDVYETVGAKLPGRALGGPVLANNAYIVGERGPEIVVPTVDSTVIPNSAINFTGGGSAGGGSPIYLTVNAGVGDPRAIGQTVIEYIKKFEKANGPVFAAA